MTPAELRQRVCVYLRGALGDTWSEAPVAPDLHFVGVARTVASPAWSVGLGASEAQAGRQAPRGATVVVTEVLVRYTARIRADGALPDVVDAADYDLALEHEATLLQAVSALKTATAALDGVWLTWSSVDRDVTGDGTYLAGTIRANALHSFPG